MGSSNDGGTEPEGEPAPRGFFGRLLSAFNAGDSSEGDEEAAGRRGEGGSAEPGLHNLRRLRVDDVAIPKVEIAAVPLDIGKDDLVEAFRKHGFSRLPVYKGTLDHPQGLVLLKDLALQHGFGASARFSLKRLLRPVIFAPPSMPAATLLQKMQRDRVHMALVIDVDACETCMATIGDLSETVIGASEDEHGEAGGTMWTEEAPGVFVAQSTAPLDDFEAAIGLALRSGEDDEDIDTLGGLVFLRAGHVPARGEIVAHESGAAFEVLEADARRIKRLRVRLPGAARNVVRAAREEPAPATEPAPDAGRGA